MLNLNPAYDFSSQFIKSKVHSFIIISSHITSGDIIVPEMIDFLLPVRALSLGGVPHVCFHTDLIEELNPVFVPLVFLK